MADNTVNVTEDKSVKTQETKVTAAVTATEPAKQPVQTEMKYSLQDLINNAKALGYKKEVVAGAFFNATVSEMTKTHYCCIKIFSKSQLLI